MRAVGYLRVSTTKQTGIDHVSLEEQEASIRNYCRSKSWTLIEPIYKDEGFSGAKIDREALQELLADAEAKKFDVVVVHKVTRFGRKLSHLTANTEKLKALGIGFVAVEDAIDTTKKNRMNNVLLGFLGTLAEFERDNIIERTVGQRSILWQRGQIPMGEIPYGYQWNKKEKKYEHNPEEAAVYKRLVTDFLKPGASLTQLAVQYEKEGLPTRNKKGRWFTATISQILSYEHPYVTGTYITKEFVYPVEPLVLPSVWREVQEKITDAKTRSGKPGKVREIFLLHGLTQCGVCGSTALQCKYTTKRLSGESERRYKCIWAISAPAKASGHPKCSLPVVSADFLEHAVLNAFVGQLLNSDSNPQQYDEQEKTLKSEIEELKAQKATCDVSLENLNRLRKLPEFDPDAWFAMYQEDTIALQRIVVSIAEKKSNLADIRHQKEENQFLAKYREESKDSMEQFALDILNAPFEIKRQAIEGSLAGKIIVVPITDGKFQITIQWRLKLANLQDILKTLYRSNYEGSSTGCTYCECFRFLYQVHWKDGLAG